MSHHRPIMYVLDFTATYDGFPMFLNRALREFEVRCLLTQPGGERALMKAQALWQAVLRSSLGANKMIDLMERVLFHFPPVEGHIVFTKAAKDRWPGTRELADMAREQSGKPTVKIEYLRETTKAEREKVTVGGDNPSE